MQSEVDTANYLSIAFSDDKEAEDVRLDRATIRKQRIAAAVQRSKTEYQPQHAYTERGNSFGNSARGSDKPKVDKQQLEYLVSALYDRREYADALQLILDAIDEEAKPAAVLNRELLDTGLRAALHCEDAVAAVRLARASEAIWRGQSAGLAVAASDAFALAGLHQDALRPLLVNSNSFGLHVPVMARMCALLRDMDRQSPNQHVRDFADLIHAIKSRRRYNLTQPLFGDAAELDHSQMATRPIDVEALLAVFDAGLHADIVGTVHRLERSSKSADADEDKDASRGVRSL